MWSELPVDQETLVAHRYRRYLLYCLFLYAKPMSLAEVADQLTVWDHQADDEEDYLSERLHIYDSLYFDHLPALCDAGVVTYSQHEDMVELGPAAEKFEPIVGRTFSTEVANLLDAERTTFDP